MAAQVRGHDARRNVYASLLANKVFSAEWNPSFQSVEVVWQGVYQGNYILCECNTIGTGRVEVQDISDYTARNIENGNYAEQNNDFEIDMYDGGFIVEIDDRRDAEFWFETEKAKAPVALKDPDEVSEDIQEHVRAIVQTAENALYSENFKAKGGASIVLKNDGRVLINGREAGNG